MKAYSMDLRKRVVEAYDSGKYTLKQVAEQFAVTVRWIQQIRRRRKVDGSIAPYPQNQGRKPAFTEKLLTELDQLVERKCDITLAEIKEHFNGRVNCSIVTIHSTLKRLGWGYKKNRYVRLNKTEKM